MKCCMCRSEGGGLGVIDIGDAIDGGDALHTMWKGLKRAQPMNDNVLWYAEACEHSADDSGGRCEDGIGEVAGRDVVYVRERARGTRIYRLACRLLRYTGSDEGTGGVYDILEKLEFERSVSLNGVMAIEVVGLDIKDRCERGGEEGGMLHLEGGDLGDSDDTFAGVWVLENALREGNAVVAGSDCRAACLIENVSQALDDRAFAFTSGDSDGIALPMTCTEVKLGEDGKTLRLGMTYPVALERDGWGGNHSIEGTFGKGVGLDFEAGDTCSF